MLHAVNPAAPIDAGSVPDRRGPRISIRSLRKTFDQRAILRNLSLDVAAGSFVAIVGRSGCGKSTLLRILAGLEHPDQGEIAVDGRAARAAKADSPDLRLMFQDARLLPWKSVLGNVALGLPRGARDTAMQTLRDVGLANRADDWPAALSGGQRQRVALARALVHSPRILLLDEPLGALDALTRIEMHGLIEKLWRQHGFTALLVTHDVQEAIALADRLILIEDGRIGLDLDIDLPRPRPRGHAQFAALEERVLARVLQLPAGVGPKAV